jgi:hypothetical protein
MINAVCILLALIGMAVAIGCEVFRAGYKANWLDMATVIGWLAWAYGVVISIYDKFNYMR